MKRVQMSSKPFDNCYWVVPHRFLAGEYPGHIDDGEARRKVDSLLAVGIDCFIDLTEDRDGLRPYANLLPQAVRFIRFPIRDVSVPASKTDAAAVLEAMDGALQQGQMVYLHCWGGVGRTGMVVGCWLARHGKNGPSVTCPQ